MNPIEQTPEKKIVLTVRETEVLQEVAEGLSAKEVAAKLNISLNTVEAHRHNIMKKTGCKNMAHVVATFLRARKIV